MLLPEALSQPRGHVNAHGVPEGAESTSVQFAGKPCIRSYSEAIMRRTNNVCTSSGIEGEGLSVVAPAFGLWPCAGFSADGGVLDDVRMRA